MNSDELEQGMIVVQRGSIVRKVFKDMDDQRVWVLFTDGTWSVQPVDYNWKVL